MTMQAMPMTASVRSGELQALSLDFSSTPPTASGIVARMIHTKKRKFQSAKSRRRTAPITPSPRPRTSAQK